MASQKKFADHFSAGSAEYAAYRPTYPAALVDFLADAAPARQLALDCACGTGQLSVPLARRFERVAATDASASQIANAEPNPKVEYRVAPAERSGLDAASVDLVTVAQAGHWVDLPSFYAEARRVGKREAVVALVTYGITQLEGEAGAVLDKFYWETIHRYWPAGREHVENGYRDLEFPFALLEAPELRIEARWNLAEMMGYVDTWSAVREAVKATGRGVMDEFRKEMAVAWGESEERHAVSWPLTVLAGRVEC